jgi:protein involved in polysaccharide export with SLBB domain
MKLYQVGCVSVLLFAVSPALYSQTTTGTGDDSQGTSINCSDPLSSALDGSCAANQQQNMQQGGSFGGQGVGGAGVNLPRSIGSSTSDNSSLTESSNSRLQTQVRPLSPEAPTEFQKFVAATTGQLLNIYAEELFRNVPSTFAPVDLAPVTSDYVIGPEDELRIRVWGQVNQSNNLRVDRSGNIYLPTVGAVHVAGLTFSDVDGHLRAAMAKVYRNFDLSVDMGRIRSMQIYVTGQARRPGVYTVSSLSSLVDALFASGGPSAQGSLRHIQLNRGGKKIAEFDLYALLIHGDKSNDIRLLPEDVLYIPPVGPQVAITGSIHNPAIYELRGGETIRELIDLSGKTNAVASNGRISLERVAEQRRLQAIEFKLDEAGISTPLLDGDILRIYSIVPAYTKTVTLRGDVANPGRFGWREGMHISDLIPDKDSLLSRDYWWKRSHLGLPSPEFEPAISTLGLNARIPEANYRGFTTAVTPETLTSTLERGYDQQDLNELLRYINGNEQYPYYSPYYAGLNQSSSNSNQQNSANGQQLLNNPQFSPDAQFDVNGNRIENQRAGQSGSNSSVASQTGQAPGSGGAARHNRNEVRISAPDINWDYAVIERIDPETLKTSLVPFELGKLVIGHDAGQDLALQPGDTVTVFSQADFRVPLDRQTKYVTLEGEFVRSGIYSVAPGETLRDVVRHAGGFTTGAYLYGSELTRESTRVLQQQRLDEYVRTVSIEAEHGTQALAVTGGGDQAASASRAAAQDLTTRLSQIRATGRIVLQLRPQSNSIDDVPMISLENGDHFVVPSVPATVNVVGAVYDQNSFLFQANGQAARYLRLAGGTNRNADWRHAFVIKADGSVISREAVKTAWGNGFNALRMNPGDTIVVPDKTLRPTALRNILDWSQVFSQLALGAAAINVL